MCAEVSSDKCAEVSSDKCAEVSSDKCAEVSSDKCNYEHYIDYYDCLMVRDTPNLLRNYPDFDFHQVLKIKGLRRDKDKLIENNLLPETINDEEFISWSNMLKRFRIRVNVRHQKSKSGYKDNYKRSKEKTVLAQNKKNDKKLSQKMVFQELLNKTTLII